MYMYVHTVVKLLVGLDLNEANILSRIELHTGMVHNMLSLR